MEWLVEDRNMFVLKRTNTKKSVVKKVKKKKTSE